MMEKMRKLLLLAGWVAIILGIGLIVMITYWLVYPYNPLEFTRPKFIVKTKTVKPGGLLVFESSYCKYMNLHASLSREFVNELIFVTPEIITNRDTGCHVVAISMTIPNELPPGRYHLRNVYRYRVNLLRTVTVTHESEEFEVL